MRNRGILFSTVIGIMLLLAGIRFAFADASTDVKPFLGRWDLTLKSPNKEYPSWLELTMDGDQLTARMVGRWGHARMLPKVELAKNVLTFVSPKEEEDRKDDMVFEGKLSGKMLSGTTTGQDGTPWTWTAVPAPELKANSNPKWTKPIELFNGRDLTGWTQDKSNPNNALWKVENETLVSPGRGPELISEGKYKDFKLHVEFNCGENANSGIYLRGRYEVQVETNSAEEPPSHHTGGVYGFLAPTPEQPRKANVWQTFDITLVGRMITVVQNGITIIDHQEIPGITGGALDSHESEPGPIYLQGSEDGHILYRKIVLTPAK